MPATPAPRRSDLAVASLVLGILGVPLLALLFMGLLLTLLGVVLGHMALFQIKKSAGALLGRRMALAGVTLGYLTLALFLVLIPVFNDALLRAAMTSTLSNGRALYHVQFSAVIDQSLTNAWPKATDLPTSTAVFTNMLDRGELKVSYAFFSAPGVAIYKGTNAALFRPENNAWCVVADISEAGTGHIPLLFTRNLRIASLADLKGKVGDQLSDEPPFGRKGVPVIFLGGTAKILTPNMLWSDVLGGATFTNRVLRP